MSMKLKIGLTGGIGSGKSTVSGMLRRQGAALIDTDAIARQLCVPGGAAIAAVAEAFGQEFIDSQGALDRDRMRERVFSDPSAKRRLESILHPLIGSETERQADAASEPVLVFDVPLLAESAHWRARVDRVLVVDCDEATQIARVGSRSGLSAPAVQAIVAQQASREQRRSCADAVVHNEDLSLEELEQQVRQLWMLWVPSHR